jgi:hypothetical protein
MCLVTDIVAHACSPNTQEAEAGGSQVPGQSGQHSKTMSQKKKSALCSLLISDNSKSKL